MSVELKAVEISNTGIQGDLEKLIAKAKILNNTNSIHVYSLFDTYMVETETGLGIYDKEGKAKLFIDEANITNVLLRADIAYSTINSCYIVDFNKKAIHKYNLTFGLIENTLSTDLIHLFASNNFDNSKSNRIAFEAPDLDDLKMIDGTMYQFEKSIGDTEKFSSLRNPDIKKLSVGTKYKDLKQLMEYINKVNNENAIVAFSESLTMGNSFIVQIGDESLKLSIVSVDYKDNSTGKEEKHRKYYMRVCGQGVQLMNGKYSLSRLPNSNFNLSLTQVQLALYNRLENKLYLITSTQWDNKITTGENFNITYKTSNYSMIVETKLINKVNNEAFISRINIGDGFMYAIEKKEGAIPNIDFKPDKLDEFINDKSIGLDYKLSTQSRIALSHGKWQF